MDNGVGIAAEMLPKVFALFNQVDPSLARSEGGLGKGLSLVRRLVKMHGGRVSATSEIGVGSEFAVWLPLAEAAPNPVPAGGNEVASGAGRRILVVDDNVDTARVTARLLKCNGFESRFCHDGIESIEVAREFRPEVVLLNIGLPGMNGFEVARTLRDEECCRDTLIIGASWYGDAQSREEARLAGFDHHLVKPVDIDSLLPLIEEGVGRG